ncbi:MULTISPECIES: 3-isopropylmalate dehydratase small subunit [unclassified Pseudoclavibacter]|uniref:3-isopropylmalate dehydratase small subunit n=1 Tax=unclassified Pseudoclavibacter TaxID=2615177 RepID=UPI001300F2B1|nr:MULTISPECIES: 3-isopropylmalate dehydratase small subunit [unclassified Pseudoclavibacter]KAB1658662.1 3-isopropylmalate dehydratase small subunit [Pseudoclavibacter sp. CFCC 11306]KAB1664372.1 3-isopropylmalate dehydratase small subunit [Pseudoclavibacter sp. CFCC 13611]
MEKFTTLTAVVAPLKLSNVDTDQILPAVYLKRVTKTGFEDALFHRWRQNPDFMLNDPAFAPARILVAGPDFATGSSREHAVWALHDYGFRAVFSPRFGDIFRGNAGKQGLVAGVLSEADTERVWALIDEDPGLEATVDLVARTLRVGDEEFSFGIDDDVRWRLLEGLDDISLTLRDEEAISRFEDKRAAWRPKTLPARS